MVLIAPRFAGRMHLNFGARLRLIYCGAVFFLALSRLVVLYHCRRIQSQTPLIPTLAYINPDRNPSTTLTVTLQIPEQPGVNQYTGAAEGDDASKDLDLVGQDHGHHHHRHDQTKGGDADQDQGRDRDRDQGQDRGHDAPIGEDDVLPEERFHRADIVSQQMMDTREKQRKEKASEAPV